jgi:peptide/nickel transport system permease protein
MESSTRVLEPLDRKKRPAAPRRTEAPQQERGPENARPPSPQGIVSRLRSDRSAYAALVLLAIIAFSAIAAPLLAPYPANSIDPGSKLLAPSASHPFGTDDMGRDLFVRVMQGGRVSVTVGIIAVCFALLVGVIGGGVAGYRGGIVDSIVMRFTDVMLSIPVFLIVLLCSSILSPGFVFLCLLIGSVQWMEVARVVRSVVRSTRGLEFVEAARALGVSDTRILVRHVLPHASGSILVAGTLGLAQAIVIESTLSYLGFGLQPPSMSWGSLLRDAQGYLGAAPWVAFFPGFMIFATVLCCHVLGEFLESTLDPRAAAHRLVGRG